MRLTVVVACFGMASLSSLAGKAQAFPVATPEEQAQMKFAPSMAELDAAGVDFTAIVALDDCSGALVRFTTSKAEDMAMVLTNGHCFEGGFIGPNKAIVNQPSERSFTLLDPKGEQELATVQAASVIYATMTDTDVTLYRLRETFAQLASQYHAAALTIADRRPAVGDPLRIVSGFWRKIYACSLEDFVFQLKEDVWVEKDSLRYTSTCDTIGGTSGSPIINPDTKLVVGINNTGNDDGESCTEGNPCEIDATGKITVRKGANYGQELYWFYSCLTPTNELDLSLPGCLLPK